MAAAGVRWFFHRAKRLASGRRSRVVLAPRPWRRSAPLQAGAATVATKAAHRGEHEISRKPIARGKPGLLGCTCGSTPGALFRTGTTGASGARLSLRPLLKRGTTTWHKFGRDRAAGRIRAFPGIPAIVIPPAMGYTPPLKGFPTPCTGPGPRPFLSPARGDGRRRSRPGGGERI